MRFRGAAPRWIRQPDGREKELHATLDWGNYGEIGKLWVRVADNGVRTTEGVIMNYLT